MGDVKKILAIETNENRECGNRLAMDISENIHIHFRDLRLEFSRSEWETFSAFIEESRAKAKPILDEWTEGVYGTEFHWQTNTFDLQGHSVYGGGWKEDGPDPKRWKIELQHNGIYHIHYHDMRIELDTVAFSKFCSMFMSATEKEEMQITKKMKMPMSEIVDRYTITKLKSERTSEDVSEELDAYWVEIEGAKLVLVQHGGPRDLDEVDEYIKRLYDVNGRLWSTEGDIRSGKDLPLEEIGRLALKVRDLNCERNGIKAEIVEKFSEGFKEIKINYKKVNYGNL